MLTTAVMSHLVSHQTPPRIDMAYAHTHIIYATWQALSKRDRFFIMLTVLPTFGYEMEVVHVHDRWSHKQQNKAMSVKKVLTITILATCFDWLI